MEDTTVVKALEVADSGIAFIDKYVEQLTNVLMQLGRVGAMGEVIPWIIGFLLWSSITIVFITLVVKGFKNDIESLQIIGRAGTVFWGFMGVVPICATFPSLFAWIGMYEPSIYLAAKALNL